MAEDREIAVRVAGAADAPSWLALRRALWPGADPEHAADIAAAATAPSPDRIVLLAAIAGEDVGLAEAALRHDYVNGCDTSPVAFLEGLYVVADRRRRGVARALVERVAAWGRDRGCVELASDAPADNRASHSLHRALGFAETERVVYFRRELIA